MKTSILKKMSLFFILQFLSSCSVIGDIFKTGMGIGIFIVIAILAVIIFVISKFTSNK